MSFLRREVDMYESRQVLGGCMCSHNKSIPMSLKYHGEGFSDVLDAIQKVVNPANATTISKVVESLPNVLDTVKNITTADPKQLNKQIEQSIREGESVDQIIKKINKKGTGIKGRRMLDRQQQMILQNLLSNEKVGNGLQQII